MKRNPVGILIAFVAAGAGICATVLQPERHRLAASERVYPSVGRAAYPAVDRAMAYLQLAGENPWTYQLDAADRHGRAWRVFFTRDPRIIDTQFMVRVPDKGPCTIDHYY